MSLRGCLESLRSAAAQRSTPALALLLLLLLSATPLAAKDQVSGTFTIQGESTFFQHVYASQETDPKDPEESYLVLLLSDKPIAEADRRSARLAELARQGKIHALKVRWRFGYDDLAVVPFHSKVPETGSTVRGLGTIDLQGLDDTNIAALVASKKLGQDWHYRAQVKAALRKGGIAEVEPDYQEKVAGAPGKGAPPGLRTGKVGDPLFNLKKDLGRLGYEFDAENFLTAVKDGNAEAVRLFLKGGMSANTKSGDQHAMVMAAMFCAYPPMEARTAVLLALLQAKGNPDAADGNNSTALLWAAESCEPAVIRAMVAAGANVNARARGGATPLMMAETLGRTETAEILRAAGGKR